MNYLVFILWLFFLGIQHRIQYVEAFENAYSKHIQKTQTIVSYPSHAMWSALLSQYVSSNGKVNYKGLMKEQKRLQAYLNELNLHPVQPNWDKKQQLAFWINAYNAFTIQLILKHYPISSITKIEAKPWDNAFIQLGKKNYSLNQIENTIIRPEFKDARIHFALNCAAKSCPKLLNEAYLPEKLDAQLEKQTALFINDTQANFLSSKKAEVSNIFEWYKSDFDAAGGVIAFINRYAKTPISANATLSYKPYDWSLNE